MSATARPGEAGRRQESGSLSLLHVDPVVLSAADSELAEPDAALWSVLESIPRRTSYLVVEPSWTLLDRGVREALTARIGHVSDRFEHVVAVTICPTANEAEVLQREGLTALHCSEGALVSEDLFTPTPGRRARFDAIYDAKWADYKRHDLAGGIRSLALIAPPPWRPEERCTTDYFRRAHAAVGHATWISRPWGSTGVQWLTHDEINAAYNEARVGLCLSRVEGHMAVSIQYLLAGLPVVTTANIGGRDEFFDPAYVRWADDDAHAVAEAVDELVNLDLDPQTIREATLAKMNRHRNRLQVWIQQVIRAERGELGRWAGGWPAGLPNKLREPKARTAAVVAAINQKP